MTLPEQILGWTVLGRKTVHRGAKFDLEVLSINAAPSSGQVRTILEREIIRHPGAVVVVPILDDGHLVLIRNQRIAVSETLWECCAGTLEAGEDPADCAARELEEETGYTARRFESLGWFYTTPGMTDEKMFAFVATGLQTTAQQLEVDERITTEVVSAAAAIEMIDRGQLHDAKSMLAIFLAIRRGLIKTN